MNDLLLRVVIVAILGTVLAMAWLSSHPEPAEANVHKTEAMWEKEVCANLDTYSNADEFRKYCKWRLTGELWDEK